MGSPGDGDRTGNRWRGIVVEPCTAVVAELVSPEEHNRDCPWLDSGVAKVRDDRREVVQIVGWIGSSGH